MGSYTSDPFNHVLMQELVILMVLYQQDTSVIVKMGMEVKIVKMIQEYVKKIHVGKIYVGERKKFNLLYDLI